MDIMKEKAGSAHHQLTGRTFTGRLRLWAGARLASNRLVAQNAITAGDHDLLKVVDIPEQIVSTILGYYAGEAEAAAAVKIDG